MSSFFSTFLYAIGFVGNLWVPKPIDSVPQVPLVQALIINLALLALFALQHSLMARVSFKRWLIRFVPKAAERSTFVLATSLTVIVLFRFWEPMGGVVWDIENETGQILMHCAFLFGWLLDRRPLYLGWLLAFWATPTMTVAHLVFAIATSAYIFIAIQLEEQDLIKRHPEYAECHRLATARAMADHERSTSLVPRALLDLLLIGKCLSREMSIRQSGSG